MGGEFHHDIDLVCFLEKGTPLYRGNVTASYDKIIERAGLIRIRVHGARQTHATLFLEQGESLKVVQERLGHEKVDILLNRYAQVLQRMRRKAAETLSKLLFRHAGKAMPTSEQQTIKCKKFIRKNRL